MHYCPIGAQYDQTISSGLKKNYNSIELETELTEGQFKPSETLRDTDSIPRPLEIEISFHPCVWEQEVQTSLSSRRLDTEYAIGTTLIPEPAHPLLSSLAVTQEEPDLNRQPAKTVKQIPR